MLVFNEFLIKAGLEPKTVAIMLHTPRHGKLKRLPPWIVRARPDLFEAFRSSHAKPATATLRKRDYLAPFVRLAENFAGAIVSVERQSLLDATQPDWRKIMTEEYDIKGKNFHESWLKLLQSWRGAYLLLDRSEGKRYVGSAYGEDNLLGRWRAHVARDLGATVNFRFCIPERVVDEMISKDVIGLERAWINRLDTKTWGLNT